MLCTNGAILESNCPQCMIMEEFILYGKQQLLDHAKVQFKDSVIV